MPAPSKNSKSFPDMDYDVSTNCALWFCLSPCTLCLLPYSTQLHLGADEVTRTDKNLCGTNETKGPYGELGDVAKGNCFCCVGFSSKTFGEISPGCGCNAELVNEIVAELKARQTLRGDPGQLKRAEETLEQLHVLNSKMDLIMRHLDLDPSSVVAPSTREQMERA